jgi:mRNA interferase RelE/StbE
VTYRVEFTAAARRQLGKFPAEIRRRIVAVADLLADNPRPPNAKWLVNRAGVLRVRIGDYRILYEIKDDVLLVLVVAVGHRRDVYKR